MTLELQVQNFYNQIGFPGKYDLENLQIDSHDLSNQFLNYIEKEIKNSKNVLDAGCGTGLTTNLFASRNPSVSFTGIDFSNSIDFAKKFARENKIKNVKFKKADIISYSTNKKYDTIICQGVLHHIPNVEQAIKNFTDLLLPQGKLILGLYHPMGKICKKIISIDYKNNILYQDQENNPYETVWTVDDVKEKFLNFEIVNQHPKRFYSLHAIMHSSSGGLCMYTLKKV